MRAGESETGPHYAASSNTEHAASLKGNLFLAVGEMDTNVDPSSTMQLVNALILAGRLSYRPAARSPRAGARGAEQGGPPRLRHADERRSQVLRADQRRQGFQPRFRIKIWDRSSGDVVYDNQPLEGDNSSVTTALGGGNVKIHAK